MPDFVPSARDIRAAVYHAKVFEEIESYRKKESNFFNFNFSNVFNCCFLNYSNPQSTLNTIRNAFLNREHNHKHKRGIKGNQRK